MGRGRGRWLQGSLGGARARYSSRRPRRQVARFLVQEASSDSRRPLGRTDAREASLHLAASPPLISFRSIPPLFRRGPRPPTPCHPTARGLYLGVVPRTAPSSPRTRSEECAAVSLGESHQVASRTPGAQLSPAACDLGDTLQLREAESFFAGHARIFFGRGG